MTVQPSDFVFVLDDRRGCGKKSLSTINRQVARYTHAQKRNSLSGWTNTTLLDEQNSENVAKFKTVPIAGQPTKLTFKAGQAKQPKKRLKKPKEHDPFRQLSRKHSLPKVFKVYEEEKENVRPGPDIDSLTAYTEQLLLGPAASLPAMGMFPFEMDHEEQALIHFWFMNVSNDFGMSMHLDTFLGPLLKYPLAFQVPLQWNITKAAEHVARLRGDQSSDLVCRSRSRALQRLRAVLSNAAVSGDEAVGSALQTIVNNDGYEKVHLKGLDTVIAALGGFDKVLKQATIVQPDHVVLMYTFAEFDVCKLDELQMLKSMLLGMIIRVQSRFQQLANLQHSKQDDELDLQSMLEIQSLVQLSAISTHVFSSNTCLGRFVRAEYDSSATYTQKARRFCALLMVNTSLLAFSRVADQVTFLERLSESADKAASIDVETGQLKILAGTIVYTTGYVHQRLQDDINLEGAKQKGVDVSRACIGAMKLYGLLSETLRYRLYSCFRSRLLSLAQLGKDSAASIFTLHTFDDIQLMAMSSEIDTLWLEQRKKDGLSNIF